MSACGTHVVPWRRSDASVENAFVETLPTKVWLCERPGLRGETIGSSQARWLKPQVLMKYVAATTCCGPAARFPARPRRGEGHGRHQHAEARRTGAVVPGLP